MPAARLPIILDRTRLHAGFLIALAMAVIMSGTCSSGPPSATGCAPSASAGRGRLCRYRLGKHHHQGDVPRAARWPAWPARSKRLGLQGRHYDTRAGYGFTAIAVGLVGRNHPIGVIVAGLLFGVLRQRFERDAETGRDLERAGPDPPSAWSFWPSRPWPLSSTSARRARTAADRPDRLDTIGPGSEAT